MGDVLRFNNPDAKKQRKERAKGVTLCRRGFHKWQIWKDKQFDVKQGRLVTVYRCGRCGANRTSLE